MIRRLCPAGLIVALLAAALTHGCGTGAERTLISDFFAASRLRDLTALARIGTVVFEPRQRGIVTSFTIRHVSSAQDEDGAEIRDVAIDAPVRLPNGSTVDKRLVVRLQRRNSAGKTAPTAFYGGWIVTAVLESPPAVPPPS